MHCRSLRAAVVVVALLVATSSCGEDDNGSDEKQSSSDTESTVAPAAPDGTYQSEVGPNEEAVTFDVEDGAITHVEGKVHGDCGGVTVTESIEGDFDIPIEEGAVAYEDKGSGTTTTLTGTFVEGAFEGTFAYLRADASCRAEPFTFTASVN